MKHGHGERASSLVRTAVVFGLFVGAARPLVSCEIRSVGADRSISSNDAVISRDEPKTPSEIETSVETLLSALDPTGRQVSEAVPILLTVLRDSNIDDTLRARSATMLARIGEPARTAVPTLVEILEQSQEVTASVPDQDGEGLSKRESTSYWAMKSLGLFGNVAADAVPAVAQILRSPETPPQLRVLAADTLGQIRTSSAIGVLTAELMKPRRGSNYETIVLRKTIIDGLALAGPIAVGAIPALARVAEDENADVRRKACEALGSLGPRAEGAMDLLLERLILDDDAAVKDAAANALAQVGQPAVATLVDLLERGGPELQWRAAKALGQVGAAAPPTVDSLKQAFRSQSPEVRIEAVDAVWKMSRDSRTVGSVLVKCLSDDDRLIRRRAAGILVELEPLPRETSAALQKLIVNGDTNQRRAAEYVIRERSRRATQP